MKKFWPVVVAVFFILLFSNQPAWAFNDEATLYLAQAEQQGGDKPSGAAVDQSKSQVTQDDQDANDDADANDDDDDYDDDEDEYADEQDVQLIPDPWVEMNRGIYTFNDRMYFWLLKPVARGYGFIIPQELRLAIRNAFYNIRFPVRFINCLLQLLLSIASHF